ncbi:MAG: type II toxin-antitoxin system VapC family toxin [Candidatus Xenobia bacterium]
METTDVSPVFLDTNVLLTATTPARRLHKQARLVLEQWPFRGIQLCLSGQILREYLVVATRSKEENGLGLALKDSLTNVEAFRRLCRLLEESRPVTETLLRLLSDVSCIGKYIHDANVVATATLHRVPRLVTENVPDFQRFRSRLAVVDLRDVV